MTTNTVLSQVPLFASLPPEAVIELENILQQVDLHSGQILFREGDPGDALYIILDGLMEIVKFFDTPDARTMAMRRGGDFIGETALLVRDGLRTATVIARSQVVLLRISHADFDMLVHRWPGLAFEMLREVSVRFWERDNATIQDLKEKNRLLNLAYDELRAAQEQIIAKEMLERELQMARKIQRSILPNQLPKSDRFQFGARMEPARAVGGDFYDIFQLGRDRIGLVVGDISDKGVPAAIFMALVRSLVRAKASPRSSPCQVLDRVNRLIYQMNEEGMFATVLFGILECSSGELRYARAGHEQPLLVKATGDLQPIPFEVGQPLGLFPEIRIDQQAITIPPGGQMLLYTDGVTDAADEHGNFFDLHCLVDNLRENIGLPAQVVCDRIWQSVMEHQSGSPQSDDITLVAICSNLAP